MVRVGLLFFLLFQIIFLQTSWAEEESHPLLERVANVFRQELDKAGEIVPDENGVGRSAVFIGDNGVYDQKRGETIRQSFIEGELFHNDNLALSGAVVHRIIQEAKHKRDPSDWALQIKQAKQSMGRHSMEDWYRDLSQCQTACLEITVNLMVEHAKAISELPHYYIRFGIGSRTVGEDYLDFLTRIAQLLKKDHKLSLLVIGRSSHVGDLAFNRELSGKRIASIKQHLIKQKVAATQVNVINLGYEPPQISPELIELYRLDDPMINLDRSIEGLTPYQINQSAILALTSP
ncbi:MAG: OmpA family protein [Magnetococcales bacterium]|nr:OmpA family protein [Magnetococcales bacterium]